MPPWHHGEFSSFGSVGWSTLRRRNLVCSPSTCHVICRWGTIQVAAYLLRIANGLWLQTYLTDASSLFATIAKMKSFQLILIAFIVACASAFAPISAPKSIAAKPLGASQLPEPIREAKETKNAAAIAAFATAVAPFAAQAAEVDEATVIGYGAGLVACVVSLAVGFAIGYGTLVKL